MGKVRVKSGPETTACKAREERKKQRKGDRGWRRSDKRIKYSKTFEIS